MEELVRTTGDPAPSRLEAGWRYAVFLVIVAGAFGLMLSKEPFGQDPLYHEFADQRNLLGIPNFFDVISNVPFLLIGFAGIVLCLAGRGADLRVAWMTLFAGVAGVSIGSAYYHWNPSDGTLVWDRLPMTVGFMGLFAALLGEHVNARLGKWLLGPAVLLGAYSVFHWHWFDDLRLYFAIQLVPLLTIPAVMILFRSRYTHRWLLLAALALYALAKVLEAHDQEVFACTRNLVSGHTLKHLLAAGGCLAILLMLGQRHPARGSP
jgi:hypothetical protein